MIGILSAVGLIITGVVLYLLKRKKKCCWRVKIEKEHLLKVKFKDHTGQSGAGLHRQDTELTNVDGDDPTYPTTQDEIQTHTTFRTHRIGETVTVLSE